MQKSLFDSAIVAVLVFTQNLHFVFQKTLNVSKGLKKLLTISSLSRLVLYAFCGTIIFTTVFTTIGLDAASSQVNTATSGYLITPKVDSVEYLRTDSGGDVYKVFWGYTNPSGGKVYLPIGDKNYFSDTKNLKQTINFEKGSKSKVFSTEVVCEQTQTWFVGSSEGSAQSAVATTPRCGGRSPEFGKVLDSKANGGKNGDTVVASTDTYAPKEFDSTCVNPRGWIEDTKLKSENTKTYFVPKDKYVAVSQTPEKNPEAFVKSLCSFTAKVAYKDASDSNKVKDIDNGLVEITKNSAQGIRQSANFGAKTGTSYSYINKGNDFRAFFPTDPNLGWKYENDQGISLVVTKVVVTGKALNWDKNRKPKLENNLITYEEILPSVDLQYQVDNTGVSKYFVLKNEKALKNDLTSITFDLETKENGQTKKLEKVNELKKDLDNQVKSKQSEKNKTDLVGEIKNISTEVSVEEVVSGSSSAVSSLNPVASSSSVATSNSSLISSSKPTSSTSSNNSVSLPSSNSSQNSAVSSSVSSNSTNPGKSSQVKIVKKPKSDSQIKDEVGSKITDQTKIVQEVRQKANSDLDKNKSSDSQIKEIVEVLVNNNLNPEKNPEDAKKVRSVKEKLDKLDDNGKKKLDEAMQNYAKTQVLEQKQKDLEGLNQKIKDGKIDSKNQAKLEEEINKIDQMASGSDSVTLGGIENKLTLETPVAFDKDTSALKAQTFVVSPDGKQLTIYPDQEYLNSKDRTFPIKIDPRVIGGMYASRDAFYNQRDPNTKRGSNNSFHLSVGGYPCIWVGYCYYGYSTRTAIRFELPSEVVESGNVIWANFRLRQYSSNGGGFRMRVRNACDFDEWNVTWNSQPCIAEDVGFMDVGTTNTGCQGCGDDRWSTDVSDLIRRNMNGGERAFKVVLHDDDENQYRGANFCAKDGWVGGHPCENGYWRGPYLQVFYNGRPTTPNPVYPDNQDFVGNCDFSNYTGNCGRVLNVDRYQIDNVNDGDGDCGGAYAKVWDQTQMDAPLGRWPELATWGPGCGPNYYNVGRQNGNYTYFARNRDNYGLESGNSVQRRFGVDTSAPIQIDGMQNLPFSRNNQLEIQSPTFVDNSGERVGIKYFGADYLFKDVQLLAPNSANQTSVPNLTLRADSTNAGSDIKLASNNSGDTLQRFYVDNFAFKLYGTNLCLDIYVNNAGHRTGDGSNKVSLYNCVGNTNQQWEFFGANNLLRSKFKDSVNGKDLCLARLDGNVVGTGMTVKNCDINDESQWWQANSYSPSNKTVNLSGYENGNQLNIWDNFGDPNSASQNFWLESVDATKFRIRGVGGRCFEVGEWFAPGNPRLWDCHDGDNEKWEYNDQTKEIYLNGNRSWCLTMAGGNINNGTTLRLEGCNGSLAQKWEFTKTRDPQRIVSKARNNLSLDSSANSNASDVYLGGHNEAYQQKWYYDTNSQEIKLYDFPGMCVYANTATEGDNVFIYQCNGAVNTKWVIDSASEQIKMRDYDFCLDIFDNGKADIRVSKCDPTKLNQKFEWRNFNAIGGFNYGTKYNFQISKSSNFGVSETVDMGWQTSNKLQYPNGVDKNSGYLQQPFDLENGQSYYVRVRAKDRLDGNSNKTAWKVFNPIKMDNDRPEVTNFNISKTAIIPLDKQNAEQISAGIASNTDISVDIKDENFKNAKVLVYQKAGIGSNTSDKLVKSISVCKDNGLPASCDSFAFAKNNNVTKLIFNWDGKDDSGVSMGSGFYEIIVKAYDKAGNESEDITGNNFVAVDTSSLDINFSYPLNGGWTNEKDLQITGGLVTLNGGKNGENNNFNKLSITKKDLDGAGSLSIGNNIIYDITGKVDFSKSPNFAIKKDTFSVIPEISGRSEFLDKGANEFSFEVIDKLLNKNTKTFKVNYEEQTPNILSGTLGFATIDGTGSLSPTINNFGQNNKVNSKNFRLYFNLQDPKPAGVSDDSQTAGLNLGKNPKGLDVSLLQNSDNVGTSWKEIPLYKDGLFVGDNTSANKLSNNLECNNLDVANTSKSGVVRCFVDINGLNKEGQYKLYIRTKDNAGNSKCLANWVEIGGELKCGNLTTQTNASQGVFAGTNPASSYQYIESGFELKFSGYLNVVSPTNFENTNTDSTIIEGSVERGAVLEIQNPQLNRKVSIVADTTKNGILPAEYDLTTGTVIAGEGVLSSSRLLALDTNKLAISCGIWMDIDGNSQTLDKEICQFSIKIGLKKNTLINGTNTTSVDVNSVQNDLAIVAKSGPEIKVAKSVVVDVNKVSLNIKTDSSVITPSGDGILDTLNLKPFYQDINQVDKTKNSLADYRVEVKNSGGKTVSVYGPNASLVSKPKDQFLNFDGVDDYVSVPNTTITSKVTNQFTQEGWFKLSDTTDFHAIISSDGLNFAHLQTYNKNLSAGIYTDTGFIGLQTLNDPLVAGNWYHVALTVKSGEAKLYLNGAVVATNNSAFGSIVGLSNLTIGRGYLQGRLFKGSIDDVRIWNTARSQAEITANYQKELVGNESGLVSYYKFNEGGTSSRLDQNGVGVSGSYVLPSFGNVARNWLNLAPTGGVINGNSLANGASFVTPTTFDATLVNFETNKWQDNLFGSNIAQIPNSILVNGKVNVANNGAGDLGSNLAIGSSLPDGNYYYQLKVRPTNASTTEYQTINQFQINADGSLKQPVVFKTQTSGNLDGIGTNAFKVINSGVVEKPIIATPLSGYVTTKGVVQVSGLASKSINNRNFDTVVCVSTQATLANLYLTTGTKAPNTTACTTFAKLKMDATGYFTTVLTLQNLTTTTTQNYYIFAQSKDEVGNLTPMSDVVNITQEQNQSLSLVASTNVATITPEDQLDAFANNQTISFTNPTTGEVATRVPNINDLKTINFGVEVDKNTESVDLDLVYSTPEGATSSSNLSTQNFNGGSTTDKDLNPPSIKRLGALTALAETNVSINPTLDITTKKDQKANLLYLNASLQNEYYPAKKLGYSQKCDSNDPSFNATTGKCKWQFNYVVGSDKDLIGGIYTVRARSYKGETIVDSYTNFQISGIKAITPSILKIEKEATKETQRCLDAGLSSEDGCKEWKKTVKIGATNSPYLGGGTTGAGGTTTTTTGTVNVPLQNTFFTNSNKLKIYGATEPENRVNLTIWRKDPVTANGVTTTSKTAVWSTYQIENGNIKMSPLLLANGSQASPLQSLPLQNPTNQIISGITGGFDKIVEIPNSNVTLENTQSEYEISLSSEFVSGVDGSANSSNTGALGFDGVDDYVSIPSNSKLDLTNQVSLETWVKFNQVNRNTPGGDWQSIFNKNGYTDSYGLMLGTYSTSDKLLRFYLNGTTGNFVDYNWTTVQPNTWYHLAVSYDGVNAQIYLNGNLVATKATTGNLNINTKDLRLGNNGNGWYPLDGALDEVRIWNVARSATDITANYNKELNIATANSINQNGLLAYYKFNQTSGNVATNSSTSSVSLSTSGNANLNNFEVSRWLAGNQTVALDAFATATSDTTSPTSISSLILDKISPTPVAIKTRNLNDRAPFTTNPWVSSGDKVRFDIQASEPVLNSSVFNQYGFECVAQRMAQNLLVGGVVMSDSCDSENPNNNYNSFENSTSVTTNQSTTTNTTSTPNDCKLYTPYNLKSNINVPTYCYNQYLTTQNLFANLTISTGSDEGVVYPSVYLEDLAGNKLLTSNNSKQIQTILEKERKKNSTTTSDLTNKINPKGYLTTMSETNITKSSTNSQAIFNQNIAKPANPLNGQNYISTGKYLVLDTAQLENYSKPGVVTTVPSTEGCPQGGVCSTSSTTTTNGTINVPLQTPTTNYLTLDGVNDFVSVPNSTNLQINTGTVETWIKTQNHNSGSGHRGIIIKQSAYGIFLLDNQLVAFDWNKGNIATGIYLNDDLWHHVAFSFQNNVTNGSKLYVDGEVVLTFTYTIANQNLALSLGAGEPNGTYQNFNGSLDDTRIWNTVRSDQDIKANFQKELVGNETGLVGYWRFNEGSANSPYLGGGTAGVGGTSSTTTTTTTATDSQINTTKNDATLKNFDFTNANQLLHTNSLTFDGVNDYLAIPYNENELEVTHEFWFKTTDSNTSLMTVADGELGEKGHDRNIILNNGNIQARVWSDETIRSTNLNLADNQWHHIAHTLGRTVNGSSGGQRLYVDGNLVASGVKSNSDFNWQTKVIFGFSYDVNKYFKGQMDDIRIWNVARSQDEIKANYNKELTGTEASLVANYKLNETTGSVAANSSQNLLINNQASGVNTNVSTTTTSNNSPYLGGGSNTAGGTVTQNNTLITTSPVSFTNTYNANPLPFYSTSPTSINAILNNFESNRWTYIKSPLLEACPTGGVCSTSLGVSGATSSSQNQSGIQLLATPWQSSSNSTTYGNQGLSATANTVGVNTNSTVVAKTLDDLKLDTTTYNSFDTLTKDIVEGKTTNPVTSYQTQFKQGKVQAPKVDYLNFNGTTNYLKLGTGTVGAGNGNSFDFANKPFSIEFWAKKPVTNNYDCVLGQGTPDSYKGLILCFRNNNNFTFAFYNSDLDVTPTMTPATTDNQWHHWSATYNPNITSGNNRFVYVDGNLVASDRPASPYIGSGQVVLGDSSWGNILGNPYGNNAYQGQLDDVRIWNTARSQTEIQASYNKELTGNETGLLAYYKLNETSGNLAGNLATLNNSPYLGGGTAGVGGTVTTNTTLDGLLTNFDNSGWITDYTLAVFNSSTGGATNSPYLGGGTAGVGGTSLATTSTQATNAPTPLPTTYPYNQTPRDYTLDFRMFVDNTKPVASEFDLTGFGNCNLGINSNNTTNLATPTLPKDTKNCDGKNNFDSSPYLGGGTAGAGGTATPTTTTNQPDTDRVLTDIRYFDKVGGVENGNPYSSVYVTKNNQIVLTTYIEENQKVVLASKYNSNVSTSTTTTPTVPSTEGCPTGGVCLETYQLRQTSKTVNSCSNGQSPYLGGGGQSPSGVTLGNSTISTDALLITKSSRLCKVTFTYDFPTNQTINGVPASKAELPKENPLENYIFSFYTIDLSGNVASYATTSSEVGGISNSPYLGGGTTGVGGTVTTTGTNGTMGTNGKQELSATTSTTWNAKYYNRNSTNYNGTDFSNYPIAYQQTITNPTSNLNYDWYLGSPKPGIVQQDQFSAQYTTTNLNLPVDGIYEFKISGDDGVQLYLDNQLVIQGWKDQGQTFYTYNNDTNLQSTLQTTYFINAQGQNTGQILSQTPISSTQAPSTSTPKILSKGNHQIILNYYENGGGANVSFSWKLIEAKNTTSTAGVGGTSSSTGSLTTQTNTTGTTTTTSTPTFLTNKTRSNSLTIYHDTQESITPTVNNITSSSYSNNGTNPNTSIVDFGNTLSPLQEGCPQGGVCLTPNKYPLTKDTTISYLTTSAIRTDVDTTITPLYTASLGNRTITGRPRPSRNYLLDGKTRTISQTQLTQDLLLGDTATDESTSSCITLDTAGTLSSNPTYNLNGVNVSLSSQPIKNRRLGQCFDGLYTIQTQSFDTAGNKSGVVSSVVERDSVAPMSPTIQATKSNGNYNGVADPFEEYLNLNLTGESFTQTTIKIVEDKTSNEVNLVQNLDSNGNLNINNVWGKKLQCGGATYTIKVTSQDKAGNVSTVSTATITSNPNCPYCSTLTANSNFQLPIKTTFRYTGNFGTYGDVAGDYKDITHAGIDLAANGDVAIYPVASGTIKRVVNSYPNEINNSIGWANHIIVDHGNGTLSIYGHLRPNTQVKVGDTVTNSTILAYMGTSGDASGQHLHLQIEQQGATLLPQFASRYAYYPPVNPFNYFSTTDGNIPTNLQAKYCLQSTSFGNEDNFGPALTQDKAKDIIAKYIQTQLGTKTEIENYNNNYQEFKSIQNNLANNNSDANLTNIKTITYSESPCTGLNVWIQRFGRIYDKNNNQIAYDGVLVLNPFNISQNPTDIANSGYIIKNGMHQRFSDYNDIRYGCNYQLGVPTGEERQITANDQYPNHSPLSFSQSKIWEQKFRYSSDTTLGQNNAIYAYESSTIKLNDFKVYPVTGQVAVKYKANGGTNGKYSLPKADPIKVGTTYCKQEFFGDKINDCFNIEEEFRAYQNGLDFGDSRRTRLILHNPSNPEETRQTYPVGKNVYILSHGIENNGESLYDLAQAIRNQDSNSVILKLDWSEGANNLNPNNTDEWIRPTAYAVYKRLKDWGFTDPSKVNLMGHSMGTLMSTEIARQFNINNDNKEVNSLILLDPPSYFKGVNIQFDVDDLDGSSNDSIYNKLNGYQNHAKARIMQAYTGINKENQDNACGNMPLNLTAKENYTIYLPGIANFCGVHGGVHKSFASFISWGKIDIQTFKFNDPYSHSDTSNYTPFDIDYTDQKTQAELFASGDNENALNPESITYYSGGQYVQLGRKNNANQFTNYGYQAKIVKDKTPINIKDFDSADKINLDGSDDNHYYIEQGSTPKIVRGICSGICVPEFYPDLIVSGSRVDQITSTKLQDAQNATSKQNDTFILR